MSLRSLPSDAAAACGGFAAVGPAGRRYRSIAAAGAIHMHSSTAVSTKCEQYHVAATQQTEHRLVVFVLKLMGEEEKGEKDIAISSIDHKQAIDVHTIRAGGYYHRSSYRGNTAFISRVEQ